MTEWNLFRECTQIDIFWNQDAGGTDIRCQRPVIRPTCWKSILDLEHNFSLIVEPHWLTCLLLRWLIVIDTHLSWIDGWCNRDWLLWLFMDICKNHQWCILWHCLHNSDTMVDKSPFMWIICLVVDLHSIGSQFPRAMSMLYTMSTTSIYQYRRQRSHPTKHSLYYNTAFQPLSFLVHRI